MRTISRVLFFVLGCMAVTGMAFGKTNSSVTLTSSLNPSTYGSSVTFTATVSPSAATGTVTFKNGSTTLGTGTLSSGKATYSTSALAVGSNSITAAYGGDTNYNSSTSSALTQTVNKATPTVTLISSLNPSTYGSSVTVTATVSPSAATGTVTFKNGTTTLGTGTISSGKATYTITTLAVGSNSITAVYGGNTNYNSSTSSALTQTVNKASPTVTLTSSSNPSTYGSSVTFTATLSISTATGTVTFKNGSTTLGTGTISSGKATYSTATLAVGSNSITAAYGGDTNYNSSNSATLTQTVNKATPTVTLTSSLNPSTYGSTVTFTATLSISMATGTVTFKDGTTTLGTGTISSGKATYSISTLAVGSHSITAAYGGDTNDNTSTSSALTQTVNKATPTVTLTSSLNPSTYGSSVTFTATLSISTATGTVTFKDGTTTLGTGTISSGTATYPTTTLAVGSHSITASYGGDANDNSSTSATLTQVVNKATPTITWATPAPITYGTALSATQLNATASVPGTFVYNPAAGTVLAAGTQTLRVTFTPTNTTNYSTAIGSVQLIVNKATPTITWATPAPITYGTALSATQLNATASVPGTFVYNPAAGTVLAAGTQTLNVTFSPTDATDYTTATGSVQLTVNNALTLTSISVTPQTVSLPVGATQQFTATGTYSDGSHGNITSSSIWTSSDVSVATISATGIATGVAEGPTTITAAVGAIYGSASLTGTRSPFTFTGSLNTARIYHTTTLLQTGKVLITGGYVGSGDFTGTSELYDPVTGNFTPTGSLIIPRSWHSATLLQNGQVLIVGGEATDSSGNGYQPTEAELYDPATGLFSYTGSLNVGRAMHSATLLQNGTVLIAGGSNDATAELYDPATGSFTYTGSLNASIENQSATLLNDGTVLLAGGDISFSNTVAGAEIYNPTTGTFTATGSLKAARTLHTATLLANGKVLIATGYNMATDLTVATAELYDPVAKVFTVTGSSVDARYYSTGTLLNNGQVLIMGGLASNDATSELSPAELYDPTSGTFSLAGNLNMARYSHTAALLNNGTVLITAGESPFSFLNTAEIYDPSGVAPPPAYLLQITPAVANVVVGGTQSFTAVDNHGYPRQDVSWTVDNSSLASVTTNENAVAVLTGLDAGQVTLTATDGTSSAQEQVTILAAGAYPAGTVIWSAPPVSGYSAQQIVQAVPTAWGPDLYSIQLSADGTQSIVQAFKADGEQMWQTTLPVLNNNSVPDGYGGLIVTEYDTCTPGQTHPLTVVQLDPVYGQPVSEVQAAGVQGRNGIVYCYTGGAAMAPQIAVRGDGAVFMTEPTNNGFPQITGPVGNYWIPLSSITDIYGTVVYVQCCVGPPMVNTDGTTYLEYEVRNNSYTLVISDTLYLMQINPDNTSSSTVLSATTQNETQLPGPIITDGNGGVLATWTVSPANAPVPQYPYQAADVVAGVVGTPYNLPFSPASTSFGNYPTLVLGENGVAFASGPTTASDGITAVDKIASFNVTSGAPNWTYQGTAGNTLSIIVATAGNGLVAKTTDQNGYDTVLTFDSSGGIPSLARRYSNSSSPKPMDNSQLSGISKIDYYTNGWYMGLKGNNSVAVLGNDIQFAAAPGVRPRGDSQHNGTTDPNFALVGVQDCHLATTGQPTIVARYPMYKLRAPDTLTQDLSCSAHTTNYYCYTVFEYLQQNPSTCSPGGFRGLAPCDYADNDGNISYNVFDDELSARNNGRYDWTQSFYYGRPGQRIWRVEQIYSTLSGSPQRKLPNGGFNQLHAVVGVDPLIDGNLDPYLAPWNGDPATCNSCPGGIFCTKN